MRFTLTNVKSNFRRVEFDSIVGVVCGSAITQRKRHAPFGTERNAQFCFTINILSASFNFQVILQSNYINMHGPQLLYSQLAGGRHGAPVNTILGSSTNLIMCMVAGLKSLDSPWCVFNVSLSRSLALSHSFFL